MTHPFHPLYGREFRLIDFRRAWGEERVYFHDDAGHVVRLPARWTDAKPPDAFTAIAAGRCHFRVDDLLRLANLIERVREDSRQTDAATGATVCKGNYAASVK